MNKSVYIHIPFCTQICNYCDFCKMFYNEEFAFDYLLALEKEIKKNYNGEKIKTLYIGGGTPSILKISELKKLFRIIEIFKFCKGAEITFECNLDDIREELLNFLKKSKVNRLSIGIQSFDKKNFETLGRESDYKDAIFKIDMCRKLGFSNINIDLIYGLPGQSVSDLKKDLKKFLKLKTEHISTYSLIIEDNTILKLRGTEYLSDVTDAKMYETILKILKKKKFYHYEVSNFAKKSFESKHNLVYWDNLDYYGFGLGASGSYEGVRYENTKSLTQYIKGNFKKNENLLSKKEEMDYEIMLGFRKIAGISVFDFEKKYGEDIFKIFDIEEEIKKNNIIFNGTHIYINPKKIYLMNEILIKLI